PHSTAATSSDSRALRFAGVACMADSSGVRPPALASISAAEPHSTLRSTRMPQTSNENVILRWPCPFASRDRSRLKPRAVDLPASGSFALQSRCYPQADESFRGILMRGPLSLKQIAPVLVLLTLVASVASA